MYTIMIGKCFQVDLINICLADFFILINWTSPFPILSEVVYFFHFILFRIAIPVSK